MNVKLKKGSILSDSSGTVKVPTDKYPLDTVYSVEGKFCCQEDKFLILKHDMFYSNSIIVFKRDTIRV